MEFIYFYFRLCLGILRNVRHDAGNESNASLQAETSLWSFLLALYAQYAAHFEIASVKEGSGSLTLYPHLFRHATEFL